MKKFKKEAILGIFFVSWLLIYFLQPANNSTFLGINTEKKIHKVIIDFKKENLSASYTTVVSVYFELEKSKHSKHEYQVWVNNMLKSVESAPLIIFTDEKSAGFINQTRKNQYSTTIIIIYKSIWEVLIELGEKRGINYYQSYLNLQNRLDPEKNIHTPFLYAIWNLKSFFVRKAIEENPFKSSFFIYTDAGAWKSDAISKWPDNQFIHDLNRKLSHRVLLSQISPTFDANSYLSYSSIIQGGFFAGSSKAMDYFYREFWRIHDERLKNDEFIGKDQTIMKIISFETLNRSVVRLKSWEPVCAFIYNPWFFYQVYFSKNYQCKNDRFSLLIV
jgi:hypothetical protein